MGSLPEELGALTSLTALIVSDNRIYGSLPSSISKLTSLSTCLLFGPSSLNTFCCPLPSNLPPNCTTRSDGRETSLFTCSPLADCNGRLKLTGSLETGFVPFVGSWRGDLYSKRALIAAAPRSESSQFMAYCTNDVFVRKIVLDVTPSFISTVSIAANGDAAVPTENNFIIIPPYLYEFNNARLVYYDNSESLSGWLRDSTDNRSDVHAHCIFVKFESADSMLWWVNHAYSQPDACYPLQTSFVPTATCNAFQTGSLTPIEMDTRRREAESSTTFIRFTRGTAIGPTVPIGPAPTPISPNTDTGATTAGGGSNSDNTNIAIIAGSVAAGAIVILCLIGAVTIMLINKRRKEKENTLVVDGNPLYNATTPATASHGRGSLHSSTESSPRRSDWAPSGPQTPVGSGADVPSDVGDARVARRHAESVCQRDH
jgi:hypothetical protein